MVSGASSGLDTLACWDHWCYVLHRPERCLQKGFEGVRQAGPELLHARSDKNRGIMVSRRSNQAIPGAVDGCHRACSGWSPACYGKRVRNLLPGLDGLRCYLVVWVPSLKAGPVPVMLLEIHVIREPSGIVDGKVGMWRV